MSAPALRGAAATALTVVAATALGAALLASPRLPDGAHGTPHPPGVVASAPAPRPPQSYDDLNAPYDARVHFVRIRYESGGGGFGGWGRRGRGMPPWAHDYPRAEANFLKIIDELTYVPVLTTGSNVLTLDDPELFRFPVAYIVEVGRWDPTDAEVEALGAYLRKGGFLIVDDTRNEWGNEFQNFAYHMRRALPEAELLPLPHDHEIFDAFFRINPLDVIPPYGPRNPLWFAIFEDNDPEKRIMVVFNFNNDIAEYWEFSDVGYYPIDLSNEAYKLGVNYMVYALTH